MEEESSDSIGPIFIPHRWGAARRRPRRRAGLPTASPTRGTASWILPLTTPLLAWGRPCGLDQQLGTWSRWILPLTISLTTLWISLLYWSAPGISSITSSFSIHLYHTWSLHLHTFIYIYSSEQLEKQRAEHSIQVRMESNTRVLCMVYLEDLWRKKAKSSKKCEKI